MSLTSNIIQMILYFRECIYKYFFGKVIVIKHNNKFYFIKKNIFVPYLFYFLLNLSKKEYVYKYDNIYFYNDFKNKIDLLPPLLKFEINGKSYTDKIKNYKSNIPFKVFLQLENIKDVKKITYTALSNPLDIKEKNLDLDNLDLSLSLIKIFK